MLIVPEKDLEQLEIIKEKCLDADIIYSVGDRIKKEIQLGNKMGFKTIWFKNGKFADEVPSVKNEIPWETVGNLKEVIELLG